MSGRVRRNLWYHWQNMPKQCITHEFLWGCVFVCYLKQKNQVSVGRPNISPKVMDIYLGWMLMFTTMKDNRTDKLKFQLEFDVAEQKLIGSFQSLSVINVVTSMWEIQSNFGCNFLLIISYVSNSGIWGQLLVSLIWILFVGQTRIGARWRLVISCPKLLWMNIFCFIVDQNSISMSANIFCALLNTNSISDQL